MRIATFNINGVNKRLANLLTWLDAARPDVACLQELKSTEVDFPHEAVREAGYGIAVVGQKTWNGIAILARGGEPVVTRRVLPGDPADTQARYLEAAVNGVLIACLYAPNGNPQPGPKFDYKLAWLDRLITHAASLRALGAPVVLAGDYNIVPTDFDIYPSTSWVRNALVQPEARERYRRFLDAGWTDAIRTRHPSRPMYSFWDYFRQHWDRGRGMRLDHILLSPDLVPRLRAAGIDRAVRGEPGASDHAPAWIELGPNLAAAGRARKVGSPLRTT